MPIFNTFHWFLAVIFWGLYFTVCQLGMAQDVIIARVNDWPPFYFQQNGKWCGTNVDMYFALGKEAGIRVEFKIIPWSRAIRDIEYKQIMIAQLTPTEERARIMHFIGPHSREQIIVGMRKEHLNQRINNLDDLVTLCKETKSKIAFQQDVFYSKEFNRRIKNDMEFSKYFERRASFDAVIKMVEFGRILGFFEEKYTLNYKFRHRLKNDAVVIHPYIVSSNEVYFGVSKTVPEATLQKLRDANERLLAKGTYEKIYQKWLD